MSGCIFQTVSGETVWKIAGRPLEGALLSPGGANRLLFAPSWRPYSPRFGTHSEFPNSFGRVILGTSPSRHSEKFTLGVGLLPYHRLGLLRSGNGIRVPMHYLPLTPFKSKDHRDSQGAWSDILTSVDLDLIPLYQQNVG